MKLARRRDQVPRASPSQSLPRRPKLQPRPEPPARSRSPRKGRQGRQEIFQAPRRQEIRAQSRSPQEITRIEGGAPRLASSQHRRKTRGDTTAVRRGFSALASAVASARRKAKCTDPAHRRAATTATRGKNKISCLPKPQAHRAWVISVLAPGEALKKNAVLAGCARRPA